MDYKFKGTLQNVKKQSTVIRFMKSIFKNIAIVLFILMPMLANAQEVEMADKFRADGKIYVVIAVFAIILSGLFAYLFSLDKKIGKLDHNDEQ
jgi:hypothetical protein